MNATARLIRVGMSSCLLGETVRYDGGQNPPIEEEGRLWSRGTLVAFHTAHKLLLMAHSVDAYQRLGRFVGR
jgi:hypothetical protein